MVTIIHGLWHEMACPPREARPPRALIAAPAIMEGPVRPHISLPGKPTTVRPKVPPIPPVPGQTGPQSWPAPQARPARPTRPTPGDTAKAGAQGAPTGSQALPAPQGPIVEQTHLGTQALPGPGIAVTVPVAPAPGIQAVPKPELAGAQIIMGSKENWLKLLKNVVLDTCRLCCPVEYAIISQIPEEDYKRWLTLMCRFLIQYQMVFIPSPEEWSILMLSFEQNPPYHNL